MKIQLAFNPETASEPVRQIFARPIARTIWCLWRSNHIVSQHFNGLVMQVADVIEAWKPVTADDFCLCFPYAMEFSIQDVRTFVLAHIDYLTGEKAIEIEIVKPQTAEA
jgi:hypothetical protein